MRDKNKASPWLLTITLLIAAIGVLHLCQCHAQDVSAPASIEDKTIRSIDELLLFFPSKYPAGDWNPSGLKYEDIWFKSDDGTQLHGWYCPSEKPRATILMAHGNGGHLASRAAWLKYLQSKLQVSTFLFDYRGYGRSEGTPTVEGAINDAKAARKKLRQLANVKDSEMLLMGESLGGAIVVQLAAESAPRGLILQSTFSSLRDIADHHYSKLSWLVPKNKLDSLKAISSVRAPVLLSHGTADSTIPLALGEKLFAAANEPKTLVLVQGAGHNNWLTEDYIRHLDAFIKARQQPSP